MLKWKGLTCVLALMACGDSENTENTENETTGAEENTSVETLTVAAQCDYLAQLYSCDGDFGDLDTFLTSCGIAIERDCTAADQALLSALFACVEQNGAARTCVDEDYTTCEGAHDLSGLSAACDEVVALEG
jgi:hypothetical protein